MRYQFVTFQSPLKLGEIITERLAQGWQLYGSPVMTGAVDEQGSVIYRCGQALTKDE